MSAIDKVRFSRDGDQFHYLWAARRCLGLLAPDSGLIAVSIEGASPREVEAGDPVAAGEKVIDIAEYYGSEEIEKASFVRYLQLKHSTQYPNDNWVPSGLKKTIKGFSDRYRELERRFGAENLKGRFNFGFVSNRPILPSFLETIEDIISGVATCHPGNLTKLKEFTSLNDLQLKSFCHLLKFEGRHQRYRLQRDVLGQEIKGYLVGDDVDAPVRLKELVTRKALSESAQHPTITKSDVLRALNATEDRLFPAPLRIESADTSIPRAQESDLVARIMESSNPVIIHATGGVGKSILSQRIAAHLPEGSVSIIYDCFGNGEYRRLGSPRHRHKDALVQIVNELATNRLCDPLIPSPAADNTDYLRAFIQRLKQCVASIRGRNEQALVCIAIDAADNAEMAAKEFGDERSFARDLIREDIPDGVRLVVLCRTERRDYLDPPPTVLHLELKPFSRIETAAFLRGRFADASENDIDEFHRLTSCNPRVQANALAQELALPDILRALGPDPTTVDAAIASQLELGRLNRL